MATTKKMHTTVAIIGAGPSGLRAAAELSKFITGGVTVFDREAEAGGIPRHSDHPGYGIRDMGKFISGPKYAKLLTRRALDAGAKILLNSTVTDWTGAHSFFVTSPEGRYEVSADVVILATGARERARTARLIPGDRTQGVLTTGQLQNLVHVKHYQVGTRAVVVGAELVSWSAVLSLKHAGCKTVLLTTEYPKPDAYWFFTLFGKMFFGVKVLTNSKIVEVVGKPRVAEVVVENSKTGLRTSVACDTVVFTGGWIPDNELARSAGIELDKGTKGPATDSGFRTNVRGVFAIGNSLHPVDTADIAAIDGASVVKPVLDYLGGQEKSSEGVELTVRSPLRWVSPQQLVKDAPEPARNRLLCWTDQYIPFPTVVATQGGKAIGKKKLLWPATPGRVFRIPATILRDADLARGDVQLSIQ